MNRLKHTRSTHFVNSPRKSAAPLITKHALHSRHPPKKRRIGLRAFAVGTQDEDDSSSLSSHSSDNGEASSSKRGEGSKTHGSQRFSGSPSKVRATRRNGKGRERADSFPHDQEYEKGGETSPKKRKRPRRASETSGSWIETSGDEGEPEYIAESDQYLINHATSAILSRLLKAELIRLWKVAGMWEDDNGPGIDDEMDDDGGKGKKELVEGLIAARKSQSRFISPFPSSPSRVLRRRSAFESIPDTPYRSPLSQSSSSEDILPNNQGDHESTPKPLPRTRSRVRIAETTWAGTASRLKDRKKNVKELKKSKSMTTGDEERKARFGEDVKSRAKGMLHRASHSATRSSTYTTTSNLSSQAPRQTLTKRPTRADLRARRVRANQASRKLQSAIGSGKDQSDLTDSSGTEDGEERDNDGDDDRHGDGMEKRLRPRTGGRGSLVEEPSAALDVEPGNESAEEADAEATEAEEVSLLPSHRRKSKIKSPKLQRDKDTSFMDVSGSQKAVRDLPTRGAKKKAMEKIKGGESSDENDVIDDGDVEMIDGEEDETHPGPSSGRTTRSRKSQPTTPPRQRRSHISDEDISMAPSSTPEPGEGEQSESEAEWETATPHATPHTTRSGKPFGMTDSKRKMMRESEEDDEESGGEDVEHDSDLSEATLTSLTRLLRDELVQMCEDRGLEVGGTKPQLAKALIEWRDEQNVSGTPSSTSTARPSPPPTAMPRRRSKLSKPSNTRSRCKKIPAVAGGRQSHPIKPTPVLLRPHIHAKDPVTPHSQEATGGAEAGEGEGEKKEAELNLDLQELGLEDSAIKPNNLTKLEKIGSGGFKDVYVGKLRGRKVAISEFRSDLSEMDIRELKLLAEFSHPNIVRFRGICIPEDSSQVPCMLVSELCENGDLFDYIRNVPCPPLKRVLNLMLDIAHGLEYLHTRKPSIIHRDCKSSNILINRSGVAKVGDFGLARVKNSTRSMIRSLVGTVNWQAPELWHPTPRYDYKVDVFSAGLVFWEMMSGWIGDKKYPWEGHNEHYIYDAVGAKHRRPSIAGLRKHWGNTPVELMEKMWAQDPADRPTMSGVVNELERILGEIR